MFGRTNVSKKIVAVAHVESAGVGVAIIAISAKGPAMVLEYERVTLPEGNRDTNAIATGVVTSLADAWKNALTRFVTGPHKGTQISDAYAVIDAPWTHSQTTHASSIFEKETRIAAVMIKDAAQQALTTGTEIDMSNLIESTVVRVELNGYPTGSPIGKMAHQLSVAALMSDCDTTIKKGLTETFANLFPGAALTLRSKSRALVSAMNMIPCLGKDYVILTVTTEASNVLVIRDGLTVQSVQISEGIHSIIKRISDKSVPEEALSLLRMIERNECNGEACEAITDLMARAEIDLARVYGDTFAKIASLARLPADLILITQSDLVPWLAAFFTRIDFTQFTLTTQPFSVHVLGRKELVSQVNADTAVVPDIELMIAGALVNSEEQS